MITVIALNDSVLRDDCPVFELRMPLSAQFTRASHEIFLFFLLPPSLLSTFLAGFIRERDKDHLTLDTLDCDHFVEGVCSTFVATWKAKWPACRQSNFNWRVVEGLRCVSLATLRVISISIHLVLCFATLRSHLWTDLASRVGWPTTIFQRARGHAQCEDNKTLRDTRQWEVSYFCAQRPCLHDCIQWLGSLFQR